MKRLLTILLLTPALGAAQDRDTLLPKGSTTGTVSGSSPVFWTDHVIQPQSVTLSASGIQAPQTLTITKAKACRLVVLEDTTDKLVIGCRREVAP